MRAYSLSGQHDALACCKFSVRVHYDFHAVQCLTNMNILPPYFSVSSLKSGYVFSFLTISCIVVGIHALGT